MQAIAVTTALMGRSSLIPSAPTFSPPCRKIQDRCQNVEPMDKARPRASQLDCGALWRTLTAHLVVNRVEPMAENDWSSRFLFWPHQLFKSPTTYPYKDYGDISNSASE